MDGKEVILCYEGGGRRSDLGKEAERSWVLSEASLSTQYVKPKSLKADWRSLTWRYLISNLFPSF